MQSSSIYSSFTALTLKIVGLVMILSSLLDYILIAVPFNPLQREWQLGFTSQFVDRGIIPLVGIALLFAGYRLDNPGATALAEEKSTVQDLRFWTLLLSTLLGLIFLLLVPLHFSNILWQSDATLKQINQKASQAETQVDARNKQVDALLKNPQGLSELEKAIDSGRVQGPQLAQLQAVREQLQKFKKDPNALTQEVDAAKNKIRSEKLEAENQAKTQALKLGLRTCLSSLLLAIGYSVIGWTGLRSLLGSSASRSKV